MNINNDIDAAEVRGWEEWTTLHTIMDSFVSGREINATRFGGRDDAKTNNYLLHYEHPLSAATVVRHVYEISHILEDKGLKRIFSSFRQKFNSSIKGQHSKSDASGDP